MCLCYSRERLRKPCRWKQQAPWGVCICRSTRCHTPEELHFHIHYIPIRNVHISHWLLYSFFHTHESVFGRRCVAPTVSRQSNWKPRELGSILTGGEGLFSSPEFADRLCGPQYLLFADRLCGPQYLLFADRLCGPQYLLFADRICGPQYLLFADRLCGPQCLLFKR